MSAPKVTPADISRVLDDHPRLSTYGNEFRPEPDKFQPWNTFEYRRENLRTECLEEIRASYDWLTAHPCWSGTSYEGKHLVEHEHGGPRGCYISNGSFIVAAVLLASGTGRKVNFGNRGTSLNPEVKAAPGVRCRNGVPVGQKSAA